MASQQPPMTSVSSTTVTALDDDMLREIFLRLPSLASLVRAAFTCRAFLAAVRSSGAFRRRFEELHPLPLLGLFDRNYFAIHAFVPLHRSSDPDLAAAVRGGEFSLSSVLGDDFYGDILGCCRGHLLLLSTTEQIILYNLLTKALDFVPRPPAELNVYEGRYSTYHYVRVPPSDDDEDSGSFRVLCTLQEGSRARCAIFSSDTGEWQMFSWADVFDWARRDDVDWWRSYEELFASLGNGWVYWTHTDSPYMLVLDTTTMWFSRVDMPSSLKGHFFSVGETKDGKPCIVLAEALSLLVWRWEPDDDGVEKWMADKISLPDEVLDPTMDYREVVVTKVMDGFVYLTTSEYYGTEPGWFMSFCLETGKVDKLFPKAYDSRSYPYIMAWPRALLGNKADPRLDLEEA